MAIMREWRAEIRLELKDEYVAYVATTGIAGYKQAHGNLGAILATRDINAQRSEIVTLSWWKDEDSIKLSAGAEFKWGALLP
jgi:hypothetical protein